MNALQVLILRRIVREAPDSLADDFQVLCEGLPVGRIYASEVLPHWRDDRWQWFVTASTPGMTRGGKNGTAGSLNEAMAAFRNAWKQANVDLDHWRRQIDALLARNALMERRGTKPES